MALDTFRQLDIPILGVVENMVGFPPKGSSAQFGSGTVAVQIGKGDLGWIIPGDRIAIFPAAQ